MAIGTYGQLRTQGTPTGLLNGETADERQLSIAILHYLGMNPDGSTIGSVQSLTNASTVQSGAALQFPSPRAYHSMQVVATGTIILGAVQLQGSFDGVNFFNMGTALSVAGLSATTGTTIVIPVLWLRAALTTAITGGGSVTVTVAGC